MPAHFKPDMSAAEPTLRLPYDLQTIIDWLSSENLIEDEVSEDSVEKMRNIMQKLISTDRGVYVTKGLKDQMVSYSAGSKYFITSKSIYEDTGEFIAGIICEFCPNLAQHIYQILNSSNDPITLLFKPVLLETESPTFFEDNRKIQYRHKEIPIFNENYINNKAKEWYINGLKESGKCLLQNLDNHPNVLTQLRIFNFFCIFHLFRYMAMLESFYCDHNNSNSFTIRPIILDFSDLPPSQSRTARASEVSYTQISKSINRFYAWGYAQLLGEKYYVNKLDLLESETPIFKKEKFKNEFNTLWALAKERAKKLNNDADVYELFGETVYDMLALDASSHPINFLKVLGTTSGILYPPDRRHPNKRFVVSQDMLEMLLRSSVNPDEVLNGTELRERLWQYFGIIIGGNSNDLSIIKDSGMILHIDEESLNKNFSNFALKLELMDFAEIMADGILQVRLGGLI